MMELLEFLNIDGKKINLYAQGIEVDKIRLVLHIEKTNPYVAVLSKVSLAILIDKLNEIQQNIPESTESIIENLLSSNKKISEIDNEKLFYIYKTTDVTSFVFNLIQNEIIRRLSDA